MNYYGKSKTISLALLIALIIAGLFFIVSEGSPTGSANGVDIVPSATPPRPEFHVDTFEINVAEWRTPVSLHTLVKESAVIVVGKVVQNVNIRHSVWPYVTSEYEFAVEQLLKGDLAERRSIKVKMLGGVGMGPNGTLLEVKTPGLVRLQNGKAFILFIKLDEQSRDAYVPLRGSQGAFEISVDGKTVHHLGAPKFGNGVPSDTFSRELVEALN